MIPCKVDDSAQLSYNFNSDSIRMIRKRKRINLILLLFTCDFGTTPRVANATPGNPNHDRNFLRRFASVGNNLSKKGVGEREGKHIEGISEKNKGIRLKNNFPRTDEEEGEKVGLSEENDSGLNGDDSSDDCNDSSSLLYNESFPPLLSKSSSSIVSAITIAFQDNFRSERILRVGLQFALYYFVAKTVWKGLKEGMTDLEQWANSNSETTALREEHDQKFVTEESVDAVLMAFADSVPEYNENGGTEEKIVSDKEDVVNSAEEEAEHSSKSDVPGTNARDRYIPPGNEKRTERIRQNAAVASQLALRLHAAGMPMGHVTAGSTVSHQEPKNVGRVLKSLSKIEGQLLYDTLLSPLEEEDGSISILESNSQLVDVWKEIGGLDEVKAALLDLVFPMIQYNEPHSSTKNSVVENDSSHNMSYGGLLSNPPGVLLYGPPGCGKTMLVRALCRTTNARVLCIRPSTLLRKYVGESNLKVRALFSVARKISPCIIFIDEMEGLFRERNSNGGGSEDVSRELKTEFMQLWDGIHSETDQINNILVVGATNRPFDVDSAFLRRMPRSFFVGLPDVSSRMLILKTMLKHVPLDRNFDKETLAKNTEGYSPSDMKEVLRTAALFPLREARLSAIKQQHQQQQFTVNNSPTINLPPLRPLTTTDVMNALSKVAPTPFSNNYRNALVEYTARATNGGRDRLKTESENNKENMENQFTQSPADNSFNENNQPYNPNDPEEFSEEYHDEDSSSNFDSE